MPITKYTTYKYFSRLQNLGVFISPFLFHSRNIYRTFISYALPQHPPFLWKGDFLNYLQNTHSKEEGKGGNYSLENASLLKSNLHYVFFAPEKAHGFRYLLKSNSKPKGIWKSVKLIPVMSKVPKFEKLFGFCPSAKWRLM